MERMKKILSSPSSRKKNMAPPPPSGQAPPTSGSGAGSSYIGVPLADIVKRENRDIPHLVTKVCTYINQSGLDAEGIFRVNGNSRIVEKIRTSFDKTGDADFEEAGDVMAVAGVLKMFLRELPDAIIPETLTKVFVTVQEEYARETEICLSKVKTLLRQLPTQNYETLKYLVQFLVLVSRKEDVNKMSPMALGIVFGPNIFRCSGGIQGLKEQGITNHIALKFICHYDRLFLEDGEVSPNSPVFQLHKYKANGGLHHPAPLNDLELNASETGSHSDVTPSDEDYIDTHRSNSPFVLDSDRSEYNTLTSPRGIVPRDNDELVEKAICSAITEHLFGDSTSGQSSDESLTYHHKTTPVPAPRRKKRPGDPPGGADETGMRDRSNSEPERPASIKHRISQFEPDDNDSTDFKEDGRPKKQRPTSKAFNLFEKQGIIIGVAPPELNASLKAKIQMQTDSIDDDNDDSSTEEIQSPPRQPVPRPRSPPKRPTSPPRVGNHGEEAPLDFEELAENSHSTLAAFKRAPGPKNRRNPSRPRRSLSFESQPMEASTSIQTKHNDSGYHPPKPRPFLTEAPDSDDVNHNATKPSTDFLTKYSHDTRDDLSPDKSPTANRKPYIPPLDLSILHKDVEGSVAITAEQGPSLSLQKAKQYKDDDTAVLSPRMSKLKQQKNAHPDTDVPPSPPTDQTHIQSKRVEDENAVLVKQLTKKIQSCKKRIKQFEENFEQENGYRPSQTDKATRPDVKRSMQELAKARKELRKVKEEIENERRAATSSPSGLAVLPNGRSTYDEVESHDGPPSMDETLHVLLKKLEEKRAEFHRPEDLEDMTREQTLQEKLSVQKSLLHFEGIHGRPTTKAEKELMRPLYDRYRNIKRILSKPPSPRDKTKELEVVPEDHAVEFTPTPSTAYSSVREPIDVPTGYDHDEEAEDFLVTRDLRLMMKDTMRLADVTAPSSLDLSPDDAYSRNLHELSQSQLVDEQLSSKAEKKRLRKVLRQFEEDFMQQTGRKVTKDDRAPMDTEYREYKQVKARLKLLDALLSKHDPLLSY